jgi:phosphoserine phosphatase
MSGGVLGTVAAVDDDGVYTGELERPFCYGQGKRLAIEAEANRLGIDLAASHAYSDSVSDLPMLEAVGHPVVVNPDARLQAIASQRSWPHLAVTHPRAPWRRRVIGATVVAGAGFAAGRTVARRG